MNNRSLNGLWTLYYFPQGKYTITHPDQLTDMQLPSVQAVVPGNVELDLMEAHILPDLFFGNQIKLLKPYELYEWWYVREFQPTDISNREADLVFHGVDCLATYWLNGIQIGTSDNMFIEHRFNVTEQLQENKSNTVAVRLVSPILEAAKKSYDPIHFALETNWEQLWIRKAPHSFGWDIMPRAVSAGLWRSVELDIHEQNEIEELYFCTIQADQHKAHMTVHYQLQIDPENFGEMEIRCSGQCGDSAFELKRRVNFRAGAVEIEIDKPMLWWPRGYGQASLYKVRTQLLLQGKVVAERQDTIGIRTVELIRTDVTGTENPGEFLFKVNDVPIFCKGSNWVPADVFHSRDASRYERILELFRETECNMVRCWGGNVYEDHAFFELCNEYGLMVWQDFALACGFYPQTIDFQQVIREEAMSVIKKLRNHPSIVLWCGDNEIDIFCYYKGLDPAFNKINREVLAEVAFQCDPRRPYLPSSPYFSPSAIAQKQERLVPEAHLWGPRDYYKSKFYTDSPHHFVSEIGYHGCPNVSSMKQFIDAESLWPYQDNEQWTTHCSDPIGLDGPYAYRVKLMADQIKELFGVSPDNLEDFVLASQISQAEAKKFFIEMTRIKKWRRTGIVWWNMMDGWPQFSDAVVDYYFGKKLAYHYIKRAQEPVCIMIDEPHNWHVQVMISNDTRLHASGDYKIWDADSGQSLLEGNFHAGANTNLNLGKIRVSNGEQRLFLMQWTMEGKTYGNHYMLGYPPFSLDTYKRWLFDIAALQADFQADAVGK